MYGKVVDPPSVSRWLTIQRVIRFVKDPIPILDESLKKYGSTYRFYLGGIRKSLITIDPEVIRHVLQKNHRNYHKSEIQTDILGRFIGQGLLTSNGDYWLRQRRLIQPGFHREKLASLVDIMNETITQYLDEYFIKSPTVDIYSHMNLLAFRVVVKSLFGADLPKEHLLELTRLITIQQQFIIRLIRQPYLRGWFKLSGAIKKHEHLAERVRSIIRKVIADRQRSGERRDDLLQMLLDSRYEDSGLGMSEKQLLDEAMILFIAGHETSANALTWAFFLLAHHPGITSRVLDEIKFVSSERPTFSDLSKLKYTRQVIDETMRLYPPAWLIDRVALESDVANNYRIEKGMLVGIYVYGLHRNAVFWPEPDKFDPDRFQDSRNLTPFTYLPFGAGPRSCIGNNFAIIEMQLVLFHVLSNFGLDLVFPDQKVKALPLVTLRPETGIDLKLSRRKPGIAIFS